MHKVQGPGEYCIILKATLIVAATELPSDLSPRMAALFLPIKAFIDEGLKKFKTKKNPAWAGFSE